MKLTEREWLLMFDVVFADITPTENGRFCPIFVVCVGKRAFPYDDKQRALAEARKALFDAIFEIGATQKQWLDRNRELLKHKQEFQAAFVASLEWHGQRFLDCEMYVDQWLEARP